MRSHVLRPLFVLLALVAALLVFRQFYVPDDFGVQGRGFTYSWYRASNVAEWESVTVKYQGKESCKSCHADHVETINDMPHALIECENCHGPAGDHPDDPAKLGIDRTRGLCLRCHAKLQYPGTVRGRLRGVDPESHNPGFRCVKCHLPHQRSLWYLQPGKPGDRDGRRGSAYCASCHQSQVDKSRGMPHEVVQCETCHGAARKHPTDPLRLATDQTREACLRCHDKPDHNRRHVCVTCHDPHRSSLQFLQFLP